MELLEALFAASVIMVTLGTSGCPVELITSWLTKSCFVDAILSSLLYTPTSFAVMLPSGWGVRVRYSVSLPLEVAMAWAIPAVYCV